MKILSLSQSFCSGIKLQIIEQVKMVTGDKINRLLGFKHEARVPGWALLGFATHKAVCNQIWVARSL